MMRRYTDEEKERLNREYVDWLGQTRNFEATAYWQQTNLRPGWAATDPGWREQAGALDDADCAWLEQQWEIAGGGRPEVDTTWITYESVHRHSGGCLLVPLLVVTLVMTGVIALAWWSAGGH